MKKSSATPDLSLLSLKSEPTSATLWEVLARPDTKNSKDPECNHHGPQTDVSDPTNCAQEGYLMCRNDLPVIPGQAGTARSMLGKPITVETEEGPRVFTALSPRTEATHGFRMRKFEEGNEVWLKLYFDNLCFQGYDTIIDKNGKQKEVDRGVLYWKFNQSLIQWTDWYYLDKEEAPDRRASEKEKEAYVLAKAAGKIPLNRGLLFVRYFGTEAEKKAVDMPYAGVFGGEYLYITLVCATGNKGYGRKLMQMAHSLAGELGIPTVVLATLPDPNTAGFYLMKMGYKFASRYGVYIDVSEWIVRNPDPKKQGQMMFVPDNDVTDNLEKMLRDAVQERVEDDGDRQARNKRRAREQAGGEGAESLQPSKRYTKTDGDERDAPATLPRVPFNLGALISRLTMGWF